MEIPGQAPRPIKDKWQHAQTVPFSLDERRNQENGTITRIIEGIVRSQRETIDEDLERERAQRQKPQYALGGVVLLFLVAMGAGSSPVARRIV